ncbi:MAG: HAD-IA family hydrolase [Mucilaginibacter polytrichastri]|nr:HAD-IA family hydrolase [Mucilaginibacter polytrichastri]
MVVFDMAGTTVDEHNLVYKTLRTAINEAGFNLDLEQVLAEGAGKEKKEAIRSILAVYGDRKDEVLIAGIYDRFIRQLTLAYASEDITPQNNATALFAALKARNILRVLNTGYDRDTARHIVKKLGWTEGEEFDALITASDVPRNRPFPDMIDHARDKFGIENSAQVIKVGDSAIDIEEGKNSGCGLSIGITTGAHTPEQLRKADPDYIIDDLIELVGIIER